jgi:thimet oligopeptidase
MRRDSLLSLPVWAGALVLCLTLACEWIPNEGFAPFVEYSALTPQSVTGGGVAAVAKANSLVRGMLAVPEAERTFANTLRPLDQVENVLDSAIGAYGFLSYVGKDAGLREAGREQETALEKHKVSLGFREDIYEAVTAYAGTAQAQALTGERKRLLDFTLRDYERNGFGLPEQKRREVQELQEKLVELGLAFEKNLADWEDGIEVSPERAGGLPAEFLARLEKTESGNYFVSLDYPEMVPFMENAADEELRRELLRKYLQQGYPQNVEILEEALAIRDRIARLLGYESWSHYVLEIRVAKTPETVSAFLEDLRERIDPKFAADVAAMRSDCPQEDGQGIDFWDWRYYNTRQLEERYHVDAFEVSKYFPLERVLDGLFGITAELFGLEYEEIGSPDAWHEDVQLFAIHDAQSGELISYFYTDLFPREGKFSHVAAFTLRPGGSDENGRRQIPVSAIVGNFTKPTPDEPSLLTHDEVETLFHEFGHILHQTLTRAKYRRFAGTSVERDFVEAPSQCMEHWVWEPEMLDRFAAHYETGEKLPREMLDGMLAAKHLNSGIRWLRQVYYATLDLTYHQAGETKDTTEIMEKLHPICGFPVMEGTHMQAGFGHLFGYDSAYYGYLWAKVYADDLFSAFQAAGLVDPQIGRRYRREILEAGGTRDGGELIRGFLGREPDSRAFLEDLGLEAS